MAAACEAKDGYNAKTPRINAKIMTVENVDNAEKRLMTTRINAQQDSLHAINLEKKKMDLATESAEASR